MTWLVLILVLIMLIAAIAVLVLPNMIAAVVASSVVSLSLTIVFAFLKAPDVAMTEAAIGVGLGSLILAIGLKRLGYWHLNIAGDEND
jgi:energy-converting hydrogenase B subunit D